MTIQPVLETQTEASLHHRFRLLQELGDRSKSHSRGIDETWCSVFLPFFSSLAEYGEADHYLVHYDNDIAAVGPHEEENGSSVAFLDYSFMKDRPDD